MTFCRGCFAEIHRRSTHVTCLEHRHRENQEWVKPGVQQNAEFAILETYLRARWSLLDDPISDVELIIYDKKDGPFFRIHHLHGHVQEVPNV